MIAPPTTQSRTRQDYGGVNDLHPTAARVVAAAADLGLAIDVVVFPEGTRTADDAARAVGWDVAQIVKSLVFVAGDAPVLALVSGANRLDEAKLAASLGVDGGASAVRRASADEVRAATGFAVGGVPPFGHGQTLRCVVDADLVAHDVVWAAAGTPMHVFAVDPGELVAAIGAPVADLAA
jgi:prolyl-tRNA editing enzyme YbaK/EbsC (Cys-tRNA(Pro) deacylase)